MERSINVDFTEMPVVNMITFYIGVAVIIIIVAVIAFIAIRKLGISSIAGIKFEQHGIQALNDMNEKTKGCDNNRNSQLRKITRGMKPQIKSIIDGTIQCNYAKFAVSSAILIPLYLSIAEDHLTTELMPDSFKEYRGRILDSAYDEYSTIAYGNIPECGNAMPELEKVKPAIDKMIDSWIARISTEIRISCEKKKQIYEEFLPVFLKANDDFRVDIVKKSIEKNERYATVLRTRTENVAI